MFTGFAEILWAETIIRARRWHPTGTPAPPCTRGPAREGHRRQAALAPSSPQIAQHRCPRTVQGRRCPGLKKAMLLPGPRSPVSVEHGITRASPLTANLARMQLGERGYHKCILSRYSHCLVLTSQPATTYPEYGTACVDTSHLTLLHNTWSYPHHTLLSIPHMHGGQEITTKHR